MKKGWVKKGCPWGRGRSDRSNEARKIGRSWQPTQIEEICSSFWTYQVNWQTWKIFQTCQSSRLNSQTQPMLLCKICVYRKHPRLCTFIQNWQILLLVQILKGASFMIILRPDFFRSHQQSHRMQNSGSCSKIGQFASLCTRASFFSYSRLSGREILFFSWLSRNISSFKALINSGFDQKIPNWTMYWLGCRPTQRVETAISQLVCKNVSWLCFKYW